MGDTDVDIPSCSAQKGLASEFEEDRDLRIREENELISVSM